MADKDFKIRILGDATGFGRAANEVTRQINGIRDNIRNLPREAIRSAGSQLAAFFSVSFVAQQVQQVVEYAGAISDMSQRVGVATDFLQEADFAARQTGASLGEVVIGLRELQRSQASAMANGTGTDANSFRALGISLEEVKSLGIEQLFRRVAQAIQDGEASGRQMEAAMQLLGRSASSLLPAMRQGFADLAAQARDSGLVIEQDLIEKLDEAGDKMEVVGARMRVGFAWIGGKLSDAWSWAADRLEATVQGAMGAWDAFRNTGSGKAAGEAFTASYQSTMEGLRQEEAARERARAEARANPRTATPMPAETAQRDRAGSATPRAAISTDALQRIGLFIGGQSAIDIQRRQLTFLERMALSNQEAVRILQRGLGVGP